MQTYIKRSAEAIIKNDLKNFPVVAILGSRQCGKSTLAKEIGKKIKNFLYLDLEKPSDLRKLEDAELFFNANPENIFCLDEIQLKNELFPILRSLIDENRKNGRFIILGSASRDLIEKSSESLAGRISFINLSPFSVNEVNKIKNFDLNKFWLFGAYPDSLLATNSEASFRWRENFIKTYIERDLPQLGLKISSLTIRRLLSICAHFHGQIVNYQKISQALGIDYHAIQKYLDIFEQSFIIRRVLPYENNLKKRLIKSPKLYIRDSGIFHTIMGIDSKNNLLGSPYAGSSWEGMVVENILTELSAWRSYFYRTSIGNELDLILEKGQKKIAVEIKLATAPDMGKGFYNALADTNPDEAWIIAPVKGYYPLKKNVFVSSLEYFLEKMKKKVL
ncbi:MAG: ATPase AAA [Candidatus Falkowbacteria bacterium GW2011_GWC2_38_22]|uniref:ATPase AAA n=1 Tax=Candidatus Falkowbacteria bacterium GW2011_GWE1_38_31 TaxID=1618638 RepID=A0A0G0M8E0_9BACT|nr:MAG: ATPase AAA [Candidatus Falkowbacteria bacterium GW2011_GWF2_38_1205]KKQ61097.1 MAG: ATPase AAA [Candidatus Falkowbacteria bacterium GW2011_GWC2_38_22]KKQ63167.1 MAG: ATPase AAA [Candidatus Falkowbacteria bacterium GW2011_GWF1_38_22]KKQ65362.1 MAG: ATPase AAA [Candidatus Falkowbacteria bacterium GW2011_GWE2_38_254]KKQ69939.1 MAG: ATPase AAA [Candidatus Falkowbacteria bacterium GW2011_GWE1_38_31]KKQ72503.1 MAG: ATPase AAA [Candidatus Falkowbacteria bacterium GW2011_GWD2_38_42]HBI97098.1